MFLPLHFFFQPCSSQVPHMQECPCKVPQSSPPFRWGLFSPRVSMQREFGTGSFDPAGSSCNVNSNPGTAQDTGMWLTPELSLDVAVQQLLGTAQC